MQHTIFNRMIQFNVEQRFTGILFFSIYLHSKQLNCSQFAAFATFLTFRTFFLYIFNYSYMQSTRGLQHILKTNKWTYSNFRNILYKMKIYYSFGCCRLQHMAGCMQAYEANTNFFAQSSIFIHIRRVDVDVAQHEFP